MGTTLEKAVAIVTQYVPEGRSKEISNTVKAQGLDRKSWSTFALSSSPKPIADLVKGRTLGHKVRLMDIILPSRNSGGIIDYPPPNVDPLMFAKNTVQALENLIALNYGHLFPAWISLLLSTDFSDELIQLRDKFVEGVHADKSGYELRFAREFGILYAVGNVAVKNGLLEWPKAWPSTAISKCYGNALRASRRDEKRVENAIAKLQQAVANRRFIPVVHRNPVPKIEDSHYGAICSYKGEKTVAVLGDALDLISGDKLVTKAFISRLKKTEVYRGGQGHAGTTQIAVPMRINGKQIEKPRFWLFNHARLMAFGTTTSRAQSSKPPVAPNRMRDASAKPAARLRKGRVGSR
jgi:hypothetical protein